MELTLMYWDGQVLMLNDGEVRMFSEGDAICVWWC
jgi:hypothetical protein